MSICTHCKFGDPEAPHDYSDPLCSLFLEPPPEPSPPPSVEPWTPPQPRKKPPITPHLAKRIYKYACTLTGRCRRLEDGAVRWKWGCSYGGVVYHVIAETPDGKLEPRFLDVHEVEEGCCPTRP